MDRNSVGLVFPQKISFGSPETPMVLESGRALGPVDIVYETYGEPNAARSNAILICHALSGDAHAAGYHDVHDRRTGWWDGMIGPGKAFVDEEGHLFPRNEPYEVCTDTVAKLARAPYDDMFAILPPGEDAASYACCGAGGDCC